MTITLSSDTLSDYQNRAAKLGKVALLYGGASSERDVSLMGFKLLAPVFERLRMQFVALDTAQANLFTELQKGYDRAFIAVLGRGGEDGSLQGALNCLGIPYTGSDVISSALSWDKWLSKLLWRAAGLPTLPAKKITQETIIDAAFLDGIAADIGFPVFVKPVHEGSSLGAGYVEDVFSLKDMCRNALQFDTEVILEAYMKGTEVTCGFLHDRILPVIAIEKPGVSYDFHEKYFGTETKYHCPSGFPDYLNKRIERVTAEARRILQCSGWGRADLLVGEDERIYLLEMNTCPGFTPHSLYPMTLEAAGVSLEEFVLSLLESPCVG